MNACQFELELIGFLREDVLGLSTEDGGLIGDSGRDDATELGVTGSFLTNFLTKLSKGPELKSLTSFSSKLRGNALFVSNYLRFDVNHVPSSLLNHRVK